MERSYCTYVYVCLCTRRRLTFVLEDACHSQGCSATNKSALYTCFSGDCVRANGSRPLRLCLTCHKELHENPEKEQQQQAPPAGSARAKKGAGGSHQHQHQQSVTSPTSAATGVHVVQLTLPELCDYDERLHQYLPDAIVRSALSFSFLEIRLCRCSNDAFELQ